MKEPKNKKSFDKGPWVLKKNDIKNFILVTQYSKENAIIKGRILYIISTIGTSYEFRGTMSVDLWFDAGWWHYPLKPWQKGFPGYYRVYFPESQNFDETRATNILLIDRYIANKELYIKPSDPILQYLKEEKT